MSNFISKEVQVIASAIKQAFESEPVPGNSVNQTDNPMQVGLIGRFNVFAAAEKVWAQLQAHFASEKAKLEAVIEAAIKKVESAPASEVQKVAADVKVEVAKVESEVKADIAKI